MNKKPLTFEQARIALANKITASQKKEDGKRWMIQPIENGWYVITQVR